MNGGSALLKAFEAEFVEISGRFSKRYPSCKRFANGGGVLEPMSRACGHDPGADRAWMAVNAKAAVRGDRIET